MTITIADLERTRLQDTTTISIDLTLAPEVYIDGTTDEIIVPVCIKDYTVAPFTVTGTATASSATITGLTGAFDNVRVGDKVAFVTGGTFTAISGTAISVIAVSGETTLHYTGALAPSIGSIVTGTPIAANSKVIRLDTGRKLIYLNNAVTADIATSDTITFTPAVKVLSKTATTLVLNTTVATVGTGGLTITPIPYDATYYLLRLAHSSTTKNQLRVAGYIHPADGTLSYASSNGYDTVDKVNTTGLSFGAINIDFNKFLETARTAPSV